MNYSSLGHLRVIEDLHKKFSNLFLFASMTTFLFQEHIQSPEQLVTKRNRLKKSEERNRKEKARHVSASTYKLHPFD